MDPAKTTTIDLVEAGYNLELGAGDWLPNLDAAGKSLLDFGLGFYSALVAGVSEDGQHLVTQLHQGAGPEDLLARVFRAAQAAGPDLVAQWSGAASSSGVTTMSELKDQFPRAFEVLTENAGYKDGLMICALDPDGHGVTIQIPSPELIELTAKERERWQMLAIHIAAGFRLRRGLTESTGPRGVTSTEMPHNAEALLDPTKFVVSQAAGGAQDKAASEVIREAAVRVDRARGKLRKSDPEEALELWHGLVRGRWSLVDWFDTDGRRFMLAKPNAPHIGDPRGLTEREHQVATYAARGETNKIIGYRFGISPPRVSALINAGMRKLGVKTQAQLVEKMRGLPGQSTDEPEN
jgi:DNA-binding CsgD family transcriptional regulator